MIGVAPAETVGEARRWQAVYNKAHEFGLCYTCASQFAWGTQAQTFKDVHPPCEACAPLVATLPVERENGWRKPRGEVSRPGSWLGHGARPSGWHREATTA